MIQDVDYELSVTEENASAKPEISYPPHTCTLVESQFPTSQFTNLPVTEENASAKAAPATCPLASIRNADVELIDHPILDV